MTHVISVIRGKKRLFDDSLNNEQQVKRSIIILNNTVQSPSCCSTDDTIISSMDINVCGTPQTIMATQANHYYIRINKNVDLITSFQSLSVSKEMVNQNKTINEILINSIHIVSHETCTALSDLHSFKCG